VTPYLLGLTDADLFAPSELATLTFEPHHIADALTTAGLVASPENVAAWHEGFSEHAAFLLAAFGVGAVREDGVIA